MLLLVGVRPTRDEKCLCRAKEEVKRFPCIGCFERLDNFSSDSILCKYATGGLLFVFLGGCYLYFSVSSTTSLMVGLRNVVTLQTDGAFIWIETFRCTDSVK